MLARDRVAARQKDDPMDNRCVLGTQDRRGRVAMRTLVLRDLGHRLGVFYNASSAKSAELATSDGRASLMIFLPMIGVQYRIQAKLEPISHREIALRWRFKPDAAKRMDVVYEAMPQSSLVDDFAGVQELFDNAEPPRDTPTNSVGCYIEPYEIERLELREDPHMHARQLFTLNDAGEWTMRHVVP